MDAALVFHGQDEYVIGMDIAIALLTPPSRGMCQFKEVS